MSHRRALVKICGVTSVEDALMCAEAGADWIGLNFHPPSPRCVTPEVAAGIVAALPRHVTTVGVFVDRPPVEVAGLASRIGLGAVQLHGQEPVEDLEHLGASRVIRAFRLRAAETWQIINDYLARAEAMGRPLSAVLVDAFVPGLAGGTGATIDPIALDARPPLPRLILAGGLSPGNVADRIARVRPWMVDVASGVESTPGRKDPEAVAAFVRAARSRPGDGGAVQTVDNPSGDL